MTDPKPLDPKKLKKATLASCKDKHYRQLLDEKWDELWTIPCPVLLTLCAGKATYQITELMANAAAAKPNDRLHKHLSREIELTAAAVAMLRDLLTEIGEVMMISSVAALVAEQKQRKMRDFDVNDFLKSVRDKDGDK